jgi:hypothetical protein
LKRPSEWSRAEPIDFPHHETVVLAQPRQQSGCSPPAFPLAFLAQCRSRAGPHPRISTVQANQKARGCYLGGIVPYGYTVIAGVLQLAFARQATIQRINVMHADGKSLRAIKCELALGLSIDAIARICCGRLMAGLRKAGIRPSPPLRTSETRASLRGCGDVLMADCAIPRHAITAKTSLGRWARSTNRRKILHTHHLIQAAMLLIGLTGSAFAQPANPARPSSPSTTPPQTGRPVPGTPPSAATTATSPAAANTTQGYHNEAEAKRVCGSDPVVWANPKSKTLHASGGQWYGKTQDGSYMCQSVAIKEGMRMAK